MSFRYLTGLAASLMKNDISLSYGDANEFGESTIYVFSSDRKLVMGCHREFGELVCYFHDLAIDKTYFGGRIKSVKGLMREFDRFIIWHHRNDLANNPFFQPIEI